MRLLIIDASTNTAVLATATESAMLSSLEVPADRRRARDIVPKLKEIVERTGWRLRDVELIAIGCGPGSYTGLRVSVITAKMLAELSQAKIVALDSLEAIAVRTATALLGEGHRHEGEETPRPGARIQAIADGQQHRIYSAAFHAGGNNLPARQTPTQLLNRSEWESNLEPGDVVAGTGSDPLPESVPAGVVRSHISTPDADSLWKLAVREVQAGRFIDVDHLQPMYLRPSTAEEKAAERISLDDQNTSKSFAESTS